MCIVLFPNHGQKIKDASGLKMVPDWWKASVMLLGNIKLLEMLKEFDKENIDENIIKALKGFLEDKEN